MWTEYLFSSKVVIYLFFILDVSAKLYDMTNFHYVEIYISLGLFLSCRSLYLFFQGCDFTQVLVRFTFFFCIVSSRITNSEGDALDKHHHNNSSSCHKSPSLRCLPASCVVVTVRDATQSVHWKGFVGEFRNSLPLVFPRFITHSSLSSRSPWGPTCTSYLGSEHYGYLTGRSSVTFLSN